MAIAPPKSIPGNVAFTATDTDNWKRLAELSRTPLSTPNTSRSTGGLARRETAQRSAPAETQQPATVSRSYSRSQSTDTLALRASRRDTAAERFTPRDRLSLSFEAASTAGTKMSRSDATNAGSGTSRTQFARATTATPTKASTATSADATGAGKASTAASAEQVLKTFDALLQRALGSKIKVPADLNHTDRVKLSADAIKALPPAKQTAFLQQAEAIGRSLGFNWGLTKFDGAGKRVPLNAGVAANLSGGAVDEYRKVASQLPAASPAAPAAPAAANSTDGTPTATQTPQAFAADVASKLDTNDDRSISTEEVAAQPRLAEAWKTISPDGKPVSTDEFAAGLVKLYGGQTTTPTTPTTPATPTTPTTPTTPADAATATPDAQTFRALDLQSALVAVRKMEVHDIAALVKSWAQGGQTVSKAQFAVGNPALAAAYFADGKGPVSVATLTGVLTNLTGKQTTEPTTTTPTTPTITPTAGTQT